MKKGIDVSTFQGEIDWKKVKAAGIEFAMGRPTAGRIGRPRWTNDSTRT